MSATVWLLNLDADDELEQLVLAARASRTGAGVRRAVGSRPAGSGSAADRSPAPYRRSEAVRRRIQQWLPELAGLLREGEAIAPLEGPAPELVGRPGRAWCPTPSAQARLRELGLRAAEEAPAPELLCRVNGRSFLAAFAPPLPGRFVLDRPLEAAELRRRLAEARESAQEVAQEAARETAREEAAQPAPADWMLKSEHGFAGRGLRTLGRVDEATMRWLDRALRSGPVQVEPRLPPAGELSMHGLVDATEVRVGPAWVQECDARGAWRGTRGLLDPGPASPDLASQALAAELERWARRAGEELHTVGYRGAFGLDALRWRDPSGAEHLHCCDLNARLTMAWWRSRDALEGEAVA